MDEGDYVTTTRYVQPKLKYYTPTNELDEAIRAYHQLLEERKMEHNLYFAPLYKLFNFVEANK